MTDQSRQVTLSPDLVDCPDCKGIGFYSTPCEHGQAPASCDERPCYAGQDMLECQRCEGAGSIRQSPCPPSHVPCEHDGTRWVKVCAIHHREGRRIRTESLVALHARAHTSREGTKWICRCRCGEEFYGGSRLAAEATHMMHVNGEMDIESPLLPSGKIERIIDRGDEEAVEAFNRRRDELRGVGSMGLPKDNERSNLLAEGFQYGTKHGRGEALPAMRERDELLADRDRLRLAVDELLPHSPNIADFTIRHGMRLDGTYWKKATNGIH